MRNRERLLKGYTFSVISEVISECIMCNTVTIMILYWRIKIFQENRIYEFSHTYNCLLYTSDAADDVSWV